MQKTSRRTDNGAQPLFFATAAEFRNWLEENHATARELWVGFYRKASGRPSITWPESVDQALCFGWIDGIRKAVDESSYVIRFTPRKATSNWSAINTARAAELAKQGRMNPAGLTAFERRTKEKTAVYSYEQRKNPVLDTASELRFRENEHAWDFFQTQAPSYRKLALCWIISAKRDATRGKRLERLIASSEARRRLF